MTKPKGGIRAFVFFIIAVIVLPWAAYQGIKTTLDYRDNGSDVECTVVEVARAGRKGQQKVRVSYVDKNGKSVLADATLNRRVSMGERVQAKVIEDKPDFVYAMPSKTLCIIMFAIFAVIFGIGIFMPIMYVSSMRRYKLLKKKGLPARAEVVSAERIDKTVFMAKMSFIAESVAGREERIEEFVFQKCCPRFGEHYNIVYVIKRNGKCVCDVIEI